MNATLAWIYNSVYTGLQSIEITEITEVMFFCKDGKRIDGVPDGKWLQSHMQSN